MSWRTLRGMGGPKPAARSSSWRQMTTRKPSPKPVPKDDPHYQPTQAEMHVDISIPDATPEALARCRSAGDMRWKTPT